MSTLTPQSAAFYRDNYDLDDGVTATDSTMKSRAMNAKANLTAQSSEEFNNTYSQIINDFMSGQISSEERDALTKQARTVQKQKQAQADELEAAVMARDPAAVLLAGQLWYERQALPTIASEQSQSSSGGGQSSQPSQPEPTLSAFIEAAKNRPASSTPQSESPVIGSGGLVDLGGGMQANSEAQIDAANKLIFTPTVNVARVPGLIESSNPQLYKLDAPTVRLPVNY